MPRLDLSGYLIIALLLSVCGWTVDHQIQKTQYLALRNDYQQLIINAELRSNEVEAEHKKQIEAAQHGHAEREKKLLADLTGVTAANAGLRGKVEVIRRDLSTSSDEANRAAADTLAIVFSECAERYGAVARDADRLANEAETLSAAWPK